MTGQITREEVLLERLAVIFELAGRQGRALTPFARDQLLLASTLVLADGEIAGHKVDAGDDSLMLAARLKAIEQVLLSIYKPESTGPAAEIEPGL